MRCERITENAFWVVTLDRVRRNSRIPDTTEDDWLTDAIEAAHEYIEEYLGCGIALATYRMTLDRFPNHGSIELPVWPVSDVTKILYVDGNEVLQEIHLSSIVQPVHKGRYALRLKNHARFPSSHSTPNAISIEFTAGWSEVGQLPKTLQRAALMLISHWYENRETVLIGTASKEIEHGTHAMLELMRSPDDYVSSEINE